MKLGVLTGIHEDVVRLCQALELLHRAAFVTVTAVCH